MAEKWWKRASIFSCRTKDCGMTLMTNNNKTAVHGPVS